VFSRNRDQSVFKIHYDPKHSPLDRMTLPRGDSTLGSISLVRTTWRAAAEGLDPPLGEGNRICALKAR